jgi:uncharacterized membrane protein YkvA (DUF1232 family)
MLSFSPDDVVRALDVKVEHVTKDDAERIAKNGAAVHALIDGIPTSLVRSVNQANLLFELVCAHVKEGDETPFASVAQAVGALLYLSSPVDLVPDHVEQGYLDDAAILELAVQRIAPDLKRFCERKAYDPTRYL